MKVAIFDVAEWGTLYSTYFLKNTELTPEQIQLLLTCGKYNMYCALLNNKIIGILIYAKLPNNSYFIEYLCVNQEFYKFGIGKSLLNLFLQDLPCDASCGLNCEYNLIGYYQKFGFILDEFILEYQGEKFFTMTKGNTNGKNIINLMFNYFWF